MCSWSTKVVISSTGIFEAIVNNTLYGSKLYIFMAHLEGSVHGRGQQQMAEVLHWTPLKRVHWTLMGLNVALHASGQLNPTVPSAQ